MPLLENRHKLLWDSELQNLDFWLESPEQHELRMRQTLEVARCAVAKGEVPVAASFWHQGELVCQSHNKVKSCGDPLAHAEHEVLKVVLKSQVAIDSTSCIYVTAQPCAMCAAIIRRCRVMRICYGCSDGSVWKSVGSEQVIGGVCAEESCRLLQQFFADRR